MMTTRRELYEQVQDYRQRANLQTLFPLEKFPTPAALGEYFRDFRARIASKPTTARVNAALYGAYLFADALDAMRLMGAVDLPSLPKMPKDRAELLSGIDAILAWCKAQKPARRPARRRPSKSRKPRPLTSRQTEAVQLVGECKGNIAAAARRTGQDRKTMEQAYRAGLAKLGKVPVKHGTKSLPHDRRGQVNLSDSDDSRE